MELKIQEDTKREYELRGWEIGEGILSILEMRGEEINVSRLTRHVIQNTDKVVGEVESKGKKDVTH